MGGLKRRMPVTFWTFVVYTLAISGVPLTSGFLSKDEILAGTLAFAGLTGHTLIPVIGFVVAGLTAFYMFRIVILTFLGEHSDPRRLADVHESPKVMTIPLIVLAVFSGSSPSAGIRSRTAQLARAGRAPGRSRSSRPCWPHPAGRRSRKRCTTFT